MEISDFIQSIAENLKSFTSIEQVRLFGSQLRTPSKNSDVDIFITVNDSSQYTDILKLLSELSINNSTLIHPVIVEKKDESVRSNKFIKENILDNSEIIYQKK